MVGCNNPEETPQEDSLAECLSTPPHTITHHQDTLAQNMDNIGFSIGQLNPQEYIYFHSGTGTDLARFRVQFYSTNILSGTYTIVPIFGIETQNQIAFEYYDYDLSRNFLSEQSNSGTIDVVNENDTIRVTFCNIQMTTTDEDTTFMLNGNLAILRKIIPKQHKGHINLTPNNTNPFPTWYNDVTVSEDNGTWSYKYTSYPHQFKWVKIELGNEMTEGIYRITTKDKPQSNEIKIHFNDYWYSSYTTSWEANDSTQSVEIYRNELDSLCINAEGLNIFAKKTGECHLGTGEIECPPIQSWNSEIDLFINYINFEVEQAP